MQVTQQAQQAQRGGEEAAAHAAGGGDGALPDAYRLQQQAAAEAALRTSPSVDMLTSSAGPSPRAPPMSAPPPAGLGMRHHASYSSLRSSVSGGCWQGASMAVLRHKRQSPTTFCLVWLLSAR